MLTERAYAVGLGLAKEGRGKLSRAAHEAIDKAKADGMEFEIPLSAAVKQPRLPKVAPPPNARGAAKFSKPKIAVPYEEDADMNVQERTHPAGQKWLSESGHEVDEVQVCSPCGYSLGWHGCTNPQVITPGGVLEPVVPV